MLVLSQYYTINGITLAVNVNVNGLFKAVQASRAA